MNDKAVRMYIYLYIHSRYYIRIYSVRRVPSTLSVSSLVPPSALYYEACRGGDSHYKQNASIQ